jgi:U3 small nucleolar ribonucleoprotein component
MTKYEDLIKQRKSKDSSVDEIAKKYKMNVTDVKIMQEWKEKYEKEHKLRQEAENEVILIKGITVTNSPELRAANNEINDLKNKIADLEESVKSKDYFKEPDYKFLVEENLDLRRRITELEQEVLETKADNIKLSKQVEDRIDQLRKAGM